MRQQYSCWRVKSRRDSISLLRALGMFSNIVLQRQNESAHLIVGFKQKQNVNFHPGNNELPGISISLLSQMQTLYNIVLPSLEFQNKLVPKSEITYRWRKYHCTAGLQFHKDGLKVLHLGLSTKYFIFQSNPIILNWKLAER